MTIAFSFIVGIVGNVTSVMVYAAPLPTFWCIFKKKSTDCYSALPYIMALLTTLLGLYYGTLKTNGLPIVTINIIGISFETFYLVLFLIYAPKLGRIKTAQHLLLVFLFVGSAVLLTFFFAHNHKRVVIVGTMCSAVAILMYAAPLSVMKLVITTKNVEFLPATLSTMLLINGSIWSAYSFFIRDIFIGIPSVTGCLLSILQITLYMIYKNANRQEDEPIKKMTGQDIVIDIPDQIRLDSKANHRSNSHTRTTSGKVVDFRVVELTSAADAEGEEESDGVATADAAEAGNVNGSK